MPATLERSPHKGVEQPTVPEKQKEFEYGSFLQLFVKEDVVSKEDPDLLGRVRCLSFGMPDLGPGHAQKILQGVVYPDSVSYTRFNQYQSESGDLLFLSRPGVKDTKELIGRFTRVPEELLAIDLSDHRNELANGVVDEFDAMGRGERHESAQNSEGIHTYAFSYEIRRRNGEVGVWGKGVNGKDIRLKDLAMDGYDEHAKMLSALEDRLILPGSRTIAKIDKGGTVSKCCALFFKEKIKNASRVLKDTFANFIASFAGAKFAKAWIYENGGDNLCFECGKKMGSCVHAQENLEVASESSE